MPRPAAVIARERRILKLYWRRDKGRCVRLTGRTRRQLKSAASRYGITKKKPRWKKEEEQYVIDNWSKVPLRELSRHLHRRRGAVLWHATRVLKLPVEIPQGYLHIGVAAKLLGYNEKTFLRIVAWGQKQKLDGAPLITRPVRILTCLRDKCYAPRKIIDEGQARLLVEHFLKHELLSRAAARFGVSPRRLSAAFPRLGLPKPKIARGWKGRIYVLTSDAEEVFENCLKHSIASESARTGRSRTTLLRAYRRYGHEARKHIEVITPELTDKYLALHDRDISDRHVRAAQTRKLNAQRADPIREEVLLRLGGAGPTAADLGELPAPAEAPVLQRGTQEGGAAL